jgi:hypothetical protein
MRVVLRQTPFEAVLHLTRKPTDPELALLGAATLAFQRAGTGRNRGRGALTTQLLDENRNDITAKAFALFEKEVAR